MNILLYYITMPFKIVGFYIISLFHRIRVGLPVSMNSQGREPNFESLKIEYHKAVDLMAADNFRQGPAGSIYYTNHGGPQHQALRHGSAAWSAPTEAIISGMENYFYQGEVKRGIRTLSPLEYDSQYTPPAMPMSIAHALMSGHKEKLNISKTLVARFLNYVDKQIEVDFKLEGTSITQSAKSVGFDAIYALSLLYTANTYFPDKKYTKAINNILYTRGFIFLLLAPITYITQARRNTFIDHIALFGLRTMYLGCESKFVRLIIRHSMRYIYKLSRVYTNPYWAALLHECNALPERYRDEVVDVHHNVNIPRAAEFRTISYSNQLPSDYSTHSCDEFSLDELHCMGLPSNEPVQRRVHLNSACLAKSLIVLMSNT